MTGDLPDVGGDYGEGYEDMPYFPPPWPNIPPPEPSNQNSFWFVSLGVVLGTLGLIGAWMVYIAAKRRRELKYHRITELEEQQQQQQPVAVTTDDSR